MPVHGAVVAVTGPPRLLALRALGLGDLLTAVPALRALGRAFPGHRRVLAAPAALAPLARLAVVADEVVDTPEGAVLAGRGGPTRRGADVAVNLHGSGPHSHRWLLARRPGRLVAYQHPLVSESVAGPRWRSGEHEVARWCRLLTAQGIPADPGDLDIRVDVPAGLLPDGTTLVHPGAASAARRWPPDRFAAVARAERDRGRPVVVTGGPGEEGLARRVARVAGLGDGAVRAGRMGVVELARLVAAADRVVVGDTGVAHLATAVATPSVVLFGPVPPAEWGPPPDRPWHRALWKGRRGDPHGRIPDAGLLRITVAEVLAALEHLPPPPRRPGTPPAKTARGAGGDRRDRR